jgi:hypothetical protein
MEMITIPKTEYTKLKRYSSAYLKIASEMADAEKEYPYDYKYVGSIVKESKSAHKKGRSVEAGSIGEALRKFSRR